MTADDKDLTDALRAFEAAEANVARLENLWSQIEKEFPTGNVFQAASPEYENRCRSYAAILDAFPTIDGWKPTETPLSLSDVNCHTIGAREVGDVEAQISLHDHLSVPGRELRDYRFRLDQQRRRLVRHIVADHISSIDRAIAGLQRSMAPDPIGNETVSDPQFEEVRNSVEAMNFIGCPSPSSWMITGHSSCAIHSGSGLAAVSCVRRSPSRIWRTRRREHPKAVAISRRLRPSARRRLIFLMSIHR
jgi:hypothetical protein